MNKFENWKEFSWEDEIVLITGSSGFIGKRLVESLISLGCRRMRLILRSSSRVGWLESIQEKVSDLEVIIIKGDLLDCGVCETASKDVTITYHLAAGRGQKTFPDAFLNSVVTTRNLLIALEKASNLRRFVNVSSLAVYDVKGRRKINETCPMLREAYKVGEAYVYGKVKQDELVLDNAERKGLPYVILRPGVVIGEGNCSLPGRVGIGTFGLFLHLGGSNRLPLTYVNNCADAIAMAGLIEGIDGEIFNILDDNCPTSRELLRRYKADCGHFASLYVPFSLFYVFSYLWEKYSRWSEEQLPPIFNRRRCELYWGRRLYSNEKAKRRLGWHPKIPMNVSLERYLASAKEIAKHA